MSLRLKPYPAVKESGVPWIGAVPEHWEVPRLGALLRERGETNDDGRVTEVLSVLRERGVIPYAEKGNIGNKKSDDITRYKVVRPNDIVVNCMNVIIGSVGLSRFTGCLSPVYYVLTRRAKCDDPSYLNSYFQTKPFQESLVRIGNGILAHRMRIPMELLKCEPFPRPPAAEQSAIVGFLEHADRHIRRLIAAKRRLIELLNEQKQAIIHQAVTRGLDPNVRLKPSGIDRLGEVPGHWEVGRLDRFITLQRGIDITKEQQVQGDIPVVSSGGISSFHNQFTSRGPGVIVGRKGTVGSVYFLDSDYWAHDTTLWVKEFSGNHPKFVYHLLKKLDLKRFDTGSANPTLNRNVVHPERVAFPPVDEQRAIASFLDQRSQKIDSQIQCLSRQIQLLWEYRTRLVADIVTGKLDVRGVELPQSEEAEELPPVGDKIADDATEEGDELQPVEEMTDAAD